jgi:hypothetical protein
MFISVISMKQEVAYTPRQTTGQTSHLLRFHLINDDEILARARLLGVPQIKSGRATLKWVLATTLARLRTASVSQDQRKYLCLMSSAARDLPSP